MRKESMKKREDRGEIDGKKVRGKQMKNQEEKTDERGDGKEIGEREGDTVRMNKERKMEKGDRKKV